MIPYNNYIIIEYKVYVYPDFLKVNVIIIQICYRTFSNILDYYKFERPSDSLTRPFLFDSKVTFFSMLV